MKAEPALPSEITDAWDAANDHPVCGKRRDLTLQHYGELLEKVIVSLKEETRALSKALDEIMEMTAGESVDPETDLARIYDIASAAMEGGEE